MTSWKHKGVERLFVSKQAVFAPPKAIRGGIPICWPQFGDMGPLQAQHGFARNVEWSLGQVTRTFRKDGSSAVTATFTLSSNDLAPDAAPGWYHSFDLTMALTLSEAGGLSQTLTVANTSQEEEWGFTTALHTYFKVDSIEGAAVVGLQGCEYLDNIDGRARKTDSDEEVRFPHEVDRIYKKWAAASSPHRDRLDIVGAVHSSVLSLSTTGGGGGPGSAAAAGGGQKGFSDAVVWNPWDAKAKRMGDYGDEEYKEHVCVEMAQCDPVRLAPGQSWTATQSLVVKP